MKYLPILFSTEMVKALLDGRKTQTRRLNGLENQNENPSRWELAGAVYDPAWDEGGWKSCCDFQTLDKSVMSMAECPYGQPGDILWVRETFRPIEQDFGVPRYEYKASEKINIRDKWKPGIHMPKIAARIFLKVTDVRIERLTDISNEDAIAEGIHEYEDGTYKNYFKKKGLRESDGCECWMPIASYQSLWCSINGVESWDADPWVWVISFERIDKPQNWPL